MSKTLAEIKLLEALDIFMTHFGSLEFVPEPHPEVIRAFIAGREAKEELGLK